MALRYLLYACFFTAGELSNKYYAVEVCIIPLFIFGRGNQARNTGMIILHYFA